ncbi:MAG: cell division protein ZapA [Lachnospiraceae bacterium]|nr:cell division protein ZapA [Lachnospiraceae bacterium]
MAVRNETDVLIGGKIYSLSGYESEEYLQRIALYLNTKMDELNADAYYKRLNTEYKRLFLNLNIADDYFKAKKYLDDLEAEAGSREKTIYELKQEAVDRQLKIEKLEKEREALKKEIADLQKQVVKLEARQGR